MKLHFIQPVLFVFTMLFIFQFSHAQKVYKGDYLGKTPPDIIKQVFDSSEITGTPLAFNFSFSPDGDELFFSYRRGTEKDPDPWYEIKYMKRTDNIWSAPKNAFFSGTYSDVDITFSPDGQRLFFASDRHNPNEDSDIFYLDKTELGWSEPIQIKGDVNAADGNEMHASISTNGKLVFRSTRPGGYGDADLYMADLINGEFVNVRNMGSDVNTQYLESDCFIAQNGSYIVYNTVYPEHNNKPQIYVTFNLGENQWSKGVPLGDDVNSKDGTIGSTISADGKYLFYSARYGDLKAKFWISTTVIEKLRPIKD